MGMTSGSTMTSSRGMPWSAARSTMCFGDLEADVGVLADAGLVVGDGDDGGAVLADQGQDALEALVLARHRVDEGLALVDREAGLERLDDRGVDRQRHVGERLHQPHRPGQDGGLVGERDAGVDVEHVGPGLDLGERIALDAAEVAGRISSASSLRPVGLMRSPMITNGRSKPMTTSGVAEVMTVRVTCGRGRPGRRLAPGR